MATETTQGSTPSIEVELADSKSVQAAPAARPLRIAHVCAESGFSGGEVQIFLLMEGLQELGHDNVLLCPPLSRSEEECKLRGLRCRTVPMLNNLDMLAVWRLRNWIRREDVDLVHLHTGRATWLGSMAARLAGKPAICTRRMDRRVKRNVRTWLTYHHLLDRAVAISPGVQTCLHEGGVPESMTQIISSSVDPSRIEASASRAVVRRAFHLGDDDVVLLALGHLTHRKGIDVLLQAMQTLAGEGHRPRLMVAGTGPEQDKLRGQAEQLGLLEQVRFLGRRERVGDLFAACDVFVMPSRREGLGVASLEAMGAGRPVVASEVGGLATTVQHERTGLLVRPADPAALAAALRRLIVEPALRERLGAAGPERMAEGFLPEQMVAGYVQLYRQVLADR